MNSTKRRRAFTFLELLIIIAIVVLIVCLVLPAICTQREKARREECLNKTKQTILAMFSYHDAKGHFPPAASASVRGERNADGYSFLYELLPYLDQKAEYEQIEADKERQEAQGKMDPFNSPAAATFYTRTLMNCPSYAGPVYVDQKNKQYGITNYKALSATHKESLACATDPNAKPKYGERERHPDGGLIPCDKGLKLRDFIDGTSNTMLTVETVDETGSYWAAGSTISLVVLPSTVDYVLVRNQFWAPAGYVYGKYDDEAHYKNRATYFDWDYEAKSGRNSGPYDTANEITCGPSSRHPEVINCGFGDGNARSVSKQIDPALLMFRTTRAGGDPGPEPFVRSIQ